ncbi:helix-turn-helix transcriptional regulator [Fictibacillus sp. 7GRE50]|uniref:helix-turn-helix domain-containing protein n=1 Tax=Fictibacillus sp. 7GRE50 TaxID=2745878 RepID=UPI0018CECFAC|nr:helix-turn-helix transcriptional regulator [Fictibacillus sp. 7GRE50]MBH0166249.1 helix-turn-helix transcriptional regulator [Fictibacillus sp. 7GRE50]
MNQLGDRLKSLREKQNKSQLRVAKDLGLSNVQLSRYESGDRKPDPEVIASFADYFEVTTDYLLGRNNNVVQVAGKEIILTENELKVFNVLKKQPILFNKLAEAPEKKIKALIRMWEALEAAEEDENEDTIED